MFTCPVCDDQRLLHPPYEVWPPPPGLSLSPPYEDLLGTASYEVCPRCGFEFGNDDNPGTAKPASFEDYRRDWEAEGKPWFDSMALPPMITTPEDADPFCRVRGYRSAEPPWGDDGRSPSFDHCPCCGVEWGYKDFGELGIERFRTAWLSAGAAWHDAGQPQDGLDVAERLRRIAGPPQS